MRTRFLPLLAACAGRLRPAGAAAWAALLAVLVAAAPARAENVYIMELGLNGIYSVDIRTGGPATLLTAINPPAGAEGYTLAVRPSDGMLFYLDSNAANPNLWRWNPETPTIPPTLLGTPGAATTDVVRLGFDGAGNLLAMNTTSSIWTLDQTTGGILTTTPLSGDLPTQSGDLCLNTTTGVLYMVANQNLYTVTSAGVSTLLGTITGLPAPTNGLVTGCAFTRNGSLLISLYGGGNLRTVNPSTLVATALPTGTGIANIGDLATAPERTADLRLEKTASTTTPGSTVSFTVTVTNDGPKRAADVRVLDLLPAGLTLASTVPSQGTYYPSASGSIPAGTWRAGALQPGDSATLVMNATVTGSAAITNTAQISYSDEYDPDSVPGNGVAGEDDQASVTITPSPDLRVAKAAATSFAVGTNGSYTISVSNAGPAPTVGSYTVTDVLPAGLNYVSAAGTGWSCANASGTVTCTSSTVIAANGSNPNAITLTVQPQAAAAPQVTNTASVAGGGEPANNAGDNTSTVTTAVCATNCPDLRVNKTLGTGTLTVGTAATYTLSVTNIGGMTTGANVYTLTDTLPAGLTIAANTGSWTIGAGWSCPASAPTTNVNGGTIVSCTRSTAVTPGSTSTTIAFPVNVANTAVPEVVNTAGVSGGGEPAAAQGNNSTSLTTAVVDFDLTVGKAKGTAGNFTVGTNSSYVFTVGNAGGRATAGGYSFEDDLPAGLTITASAPTSGTGTGNGWTIGTGWTCARNVDVAGANVAGGTRIYCTRSTAIAAGANAPTVTVPVSVGAAAAPSVTNTVSVSGAQEAAAFQGNNSGTLTTPVNAVDLAITKSHNGSLAVGTTAAYTVTVTNIGAVATTGTITVVDTLPAGLTYVSTAGTGTGWSCSYAAPNVTCTRTTAIGVSLSAPPIVINVTPTAGGSVTNTASVSGGNEPAGNSGNNTAADTATVYYPPVIAKAFSPATIVSGATTTLTITITNPAGSGVASVTGVTFSDPFPAGMSVASTPALTNTCGGTVSPGGSQGDTVLALANGTLGGPGTSCQISVTVTATGTGTKTNTTGQVRSDNSGIGNTASANLVVTAPGNPVLTKVSSPSVVGVGEAATLTFTITNKSATSPDLGFRDTLPAGVVTTTTTFGGTCTSTGGAGLIRTVTSGNTVINVSGVDLGSGASCTVTIPIRASAAGSYANTSANISNLAGGLTATTLSDILEVQPATLTKSFAPASIVVNTPSTMSFLVSNGAALPEINGIGFTETLPAGVVLAAVPAASQCGGTVTGTAGGSTVVVSGVTLAAGLANCTITASVTAAAAGTYVNQASNVTGVTANLVNAANATLTATVLLPTLAKTDNQSTVSPGDSTTYVITVGNDTGTTFSGGSAVVLRDPAVANLTLTGVACAAAGGATCPAGTSAAMVAALQSAGGLTIPTLPDGGTVTFTVQASVNGNPVGTLTNTASASANGGSVSASDTDTIVYPGLVHTKTVAVLNDPVNGTTLPKSIPGAEQLYTVTVANTGQGRVDTDTLLLSDAVPANTSLFVGNLGGSPAGPVTFGESGSGLTFAFTALAAPGDDVEFSSDGGSTWTYTPVPDADGYDAAVTTIRLRPKGRMEGWSGSGAYPSFTFTFKVKIR